MKKSIEVNKEFNIFRLLICLFAFSAQKSHFLFIVLLEDMYNHILLVNCKKKKKKKKNQDLTFLS